MGCLGDAKAMSVLSVSPSNCAMRSWKFWLTPPQDPIRGEALRIHVLFSGLAKQDSAGLVSKRMGVWAFRPQRNPEAEPLVFLHALR